jgi:hypothetical protein
MCNDPDLRFEGRRRDYSRSANIVFMQLREDDGQSRSNPRDFITSVCSVDVSTMEMAPVLRRLEKAADRQVNRTIFTGTTL